MDNYDRLFFLKLLSLVNYVWQFKQNYMSDVVLSVHTGNINCSGKRDIKGGKVSTCHLMG